MAYTRAILVQSLERAILKDLELATTGDLEDVHEFPPPSRPRELFVSPAQSVCLRLAR